MSTPAVSVVMPVYNTQRYLREAVESILKQTFTDFELIAINDGSTDCSGEILAEFAARDPRVRVETQANLGLVAALNRGFSLARGQFIARMDADDVAMPQRLELQVKFLRANPDCVAVGSRVRTIDPEGFPIAEAFFLTTHHEIDSANLIGHTAMAHPSVMLRRSALPSDGPYRTSFAEDLDLWLRLGERGKLANLPQILHKYRMHGSSMMLDRRYLNEQVLLDVLNDARRRRGLPQMKRATSSFPRIAGRHARANYARAALHGGNYGSAIVLSCKAVRHAPAYPAAWATLLLAMLGPIGRALLKRRAAPQATDQRTPAT